MTEPLLRATGLRKAFPGVLALDEVDFELHGGEIHAVVGKNGAGKSTLISIVSGVLRPDAGTFYLNGEVLSLSRYGDLKVATVFQESTTFPNLTIAENIYAGNEPSGILRNVERDAENARARKHLGHFGIDAEPDQLIETVSRAEQKVIEIIRSLERQCRILILDEPTAALSLPETDRLFKLLRQAKRNGVAIIYISHRLEEIFQIADRVTVLRDGHVTLSRSTGAIDLRQLIAEIVGERGATEKAIVAPPTANAGDRFGARPARFEARHLFHARGRFSDVSLVIREGEIVGLGGLVGAGKTEFGKALFGAEGVARGEMLVDGAIVSPSSPREAIAKGLVYVTEDRKHEGLFLDMTIADNLIAPILSRFANAWRMLRSGAMTRAARKTMREVEVKATGVDQIVATLSGGNQQKVLLGRWLQISPRVLVVDEPTIGVDIAAREEIYRLLRLRAADGAAVLFISSELRELMENTDRIVTMHEGRVTGTFASRSVSEGRLLEAIAGGGGN